MTKAAGAGPHARLPPAVIFDTAVSRAAIAIAIVCGLGVAAGPASVKLPPVLVSAEHLGVPSPWLPLCAKADVANAAGSAVINGIGKWWMVSIC
jgi:hypothetical protein